LSDSSYPQKFKAAGFAWDKDSIEKGKDIEVNIILTRISDGKSLTFKAGRSAVHNGRTILFHLAAFSSDIILPETKNAENWTVVARMTTKTGLTLETAPRRIKIDPAADNREFRFFSPPHIIAIILITLCAVLIFLLFGNSRGKRLQPYFSFFLAFILCANEIFYHWYWSAIGAWNTPGSLMLHMCGLAILIIPFALFAGKEKMRQYLAELIYFWGLGGAVQAILTPDIGLHGFPEIKYFNFFISHGFIILSSIFIIRILSIRIRLSSFIRVIIITNIAVGLIFVINNLLKLVPPFEAGNYFFVSYPPPDGSLIDLFVQIFGPSPRYLIGLELMGAAIFGFLCLPFSFSRKPAVTKKVKI
jgi:hypothetical integral membrane protein (TIGR02206 family)